MAKHELSAQLFHSGSSHREAGADAQTDVSRCVLSLELISGHGQLPGTVTITVLMIGSWRNLLPEPSRPFQGLTVDMIPSRQTPVTSVSSWVHTVPLVF